MTKDEFLTTLYDIAEGSGAVSYSFDVPPVYTKLWNHLDWARWVFNHGKFNFEKDGYKFYIDEIHEFPEHTKVTVYRVVNGAKFYQDLEPKEILEAVKCTK